jgi:rhodanese-related sulfurtransferase
MPSITEITVTQLVRLIGLPDTPTIIDVRIDDDNVTDPRLIPSSIRRSHKNIAEWAGDFKQQKLIISCQRGEKLSQGVAALLRHEGIDAISLEGGFEAWAGANALLLNPQKLPILDADGKTLWVTRARPKVDRIACPWLIRRFIDKNAVFLFVSPSEVLGVAERFNATPFDIDDVFWSHRGDDCTFDTMLAEFGLSSPALNRFATIIRGADTARLDLAPQCEGFLAASVGLSRMYRDDLEQLNAGMMLYDAFYRWCRDASDETHNWPATGKVTK